MSHLINLKKAQALCILQNVRDMTLTNYQKFVTLIKKTVKWSLPNPQEQYSAAILT